MGSLILGWIKRRTLCNHFPPEFYLNNTFIIVYFFPQRHYRIFVKFVYPWSTRVHNCKLKLLIIVTLSKRASIEYPIKLEKTKQSRSFTDLLQSKSINQYFYVYIIPTVYPKCDSIRLLVSLCPVRLEGFVSWLADLYWIRWLFVAA